MPRRVVEDGGFRPVEWRWTDLPQVRWKLKVLKVLLSWSFERENWKMKKVLLSGGGPIFHRFRSTMIVFSNSKISLMMVWSSIYGTCWGGAPCHSLTHTQTEKAWFKALGDTCHSSDIRSDQIMILMYMRTLKGKPFKKKHVLWS